MPTATAAPTEHLHLFLLSYNSFMDPQNNSSPAVAAVPAANVQQPKEFFIQPHNISPVATLPVDVQKSTNSEYSTVVTVTVEEARELLSSGHVYLDVRTAEEFEKGHADNAVCVPYMFFTPEGRVKNVEFVRHVSMVCKKQDHIVVGCQSGVRSLHATTDLLNAGYKNVKNMGGGYLAWVKNGFTVKKPQEEELKK
ncbi:hypothetical protein J5N97_016212 [Dioscorea zingiberensis]|uniref:Rhodanese domain-containing protein n=1 Tax=Dioscorea zingiberensis TaxID=325984 RepID=A0A9D5CKL6_9LILI|nr:hypothetical protein J5N97_016212 [Dioscorea zingiberensis]